MKFRKIRLTAAAFATGAAALAVPLFSAGGAQAATTAPAVSSPAVADVGAQLAAAHAHHEHHLEFLAQLDQEIQPGD